MTHVLYINFTNRNIFIYLNNCIYSMGHYNIKNKNKKNYNNIFLFINNILYKIKNKKNYKYLELYIKGFNTYKNNIIRYILVYLNKLQINIKYINNITNIPYH